MFGAFVEKVKDAFGVTSASEEHLCPDNATVDHGGDSAATISATSNAWDKAKDKVSHVKDEITQAVPFGSIVYCKSDESKHTTNSFMGSGFEDANDDHNTWSDEDIIGTGSDDRKFVIRGGIKLRSDGDPPNCRKIGHAHHYLALTYK